MPAVSLEDGQTQQQDEELLPESALHDARLCPLLSEDGLRRAPNPRPFLWDQLPRKDQLTQRGPPHRHDHGPPPPHPANCEAVTRVMMDTLKGGETIKHHDVIVLQTSIYSALIKQRPGARKLFRCLYSCLSDLSLLGWGHVEKTKTD